MSEQEVWYDPIKNLKEKIEEGVKWGKETNRKIDKSGPVKIFIIYLRVVTSGSRIKLCSFYLFLKQSAYIHIFLLE